MNKTCNGMPGKCAEEDLVVYLAFTPIILLIYALRLIHRLDENSEILKKSFKLDCHFKWLTHIEF